MNKEVLKLAAQGGCVIFTLLCFVDWVSSSHKPTVDKIITVQKDHVASVASGTNSLTPSVRLVIEAVLHHVRDEMEHVTGTNDIDTLKTVEAALTNALTRP